MGISFDKVVLQGTSGVYRQTSAATKKVLHVKKASGTGKFFDEIRISTQGETAVEEKDFVRMLASRLSAGVRQAVEPDRLEELRDRFDSGKYEIDANAIAGRILLEDRGEV